MKNIAAKYYSYCLKGDVRSGLRAIRETSGTENRRTMDLRHKAIRRFIECNDTERINCRDGFVKEVIRVYRNYYREVLLRPNRQSHFDKKLNDSLIRLADVNNLKIGSKFSCEALEQVLKNEIKRHGYHSLFGVVAPFRSLLIWKRQTAKNFLITLPVGKQRVKVIFMKDFSELSWLHYATFGKYYVGGWADRNALYCVKQAYKVNGPAFRVHYLVHEAQHFSDYRNYPRLQQVDLEYRAKLAELSLSKMPRAFLKKLKMESKNDRRAPHSMAAFNILQHFDGTLSASHVRQLASALLKEHSWKLRRSAKS